ncbi:MAG: D-aminoacyl-tRNA deacylase [Alphaproteobacteria bacterium]|jgi:D-tyrosyl-tRNA(Tyr) deacylase|nr:D-aminoacyl-tRNA deacylase [Alphaproteobacteria bacterium]|tara:strand:- start:1470 stop:1928 length:459 start_codon:yes stop_codon:yes gene_type:complete
MRALLQRVSEARVEVADQVIGEIGGGLLILICAVEGDGEAEAELLARKIAKLRIFRDAEGKMNRSIADAGGRALVVSQFTLAADLSRGNRPGFSRAAAPDLGCELYEHFCRLLADEGLKVETGEFGAEMAVSLVNDGPVTIWMDSADWARGP